MCNSRGEYAPLKIQRGDCSATLPNPCGRYQGTTPTTWLNFYTPCKSQLQNAWPVSPTTRSFHVCNGVKQGAVISPILFVVYYDELIAKLARSGYGCRISQHFVGALSYADDITLLSPSLQGLQYMVNICEEYGKEFHVTFNDKKTTGMVFGASNGNCKAIQVNGNNVDWVTNAIHLGNVVDNKLSDLKDR